MSWEYEHWDNGKVYLHNEKWEDFKDNLQSNGDYPHNWNHKRSIIKIHSPRDKVTDIPCPGDSLNKYVIRTTDTLNWSVIYQPFPAFERTVSDPEGWLPSWFLWIEDNHHNPLGEQIDIFTTGEIYSSTNLLNIYSFTITNRFVRFQNKYWYLDYLQDYGLGTNPPPVPPKKHKKIEARDIFEPFESW